MKRVLLTGATGFVGRATAPLLAQGADEVHALSSQERSRLPEPAPKGWHWHRADLLDAREVDALLDRVRPTHLLHLAWELPSDFYTSTRNLHWMRATARLLARFQESGGERALLAGTCAEYDWSWGYCTENQTPTRPETLYGQCKDIVRRIAFAHAEATGLSVCWARLFFLYGPGQPARTLVPSVIRGLLNGEPVACSAGEQIRDYLHVRDVASALAALLPSDVEGPVNVASGIPVRVREIVTAIANQLDGGELIRFGALPVRPGEPNLVLGNVDRLRHEVGWEPGLSLQEGIRDTIAWWTDALSQEPED